MRKLLSIALTAGILFGVCTAFGQISAAPSLELLSERTASPAAASPPAATATSAATDPDSATATAADMQEYATRLASLQDNDTEARLTLARWRADRGLWSRAIYLARAALSREPGNKVAYLILQQADQARPLPNEPKVEQMLKADCDARFDHPFKTRQSQHFLFCYDTTDAFAAQRGAAMEQVYDAFQFYFNMSVLRPQFLRHRLMVILLNDRVEYLAYTAATLHTDMSWSEGVYVPPFNLSLFFDATTGPTVASFNQEDALLRSHLQTLTRQIAAATAQNQPTLANQLMQERNHTGEALARNNNRQGNAAKLTNLFTTAHEAAHQIAFNTGIQTRGVDYPLWFSEGLACAFESEDRNGRRGPAVLNPDRIVSLKNAMARGTLVPVEQFITRPRPETLNNDNAEIFYAEGWGLFHYLYKTDRAGVEKFLISYNTPPLLLSTTADEKRRLFTDAFGANLDQLDKKFVAYLRTLPTPQMLSQ